MSDERIKELIIKMEQEEKQKKGILAVKCKYALTIIQISSIK